ncbi:PPE domain-containing protein [Gordonia sp. CPCC 205515]|uniref:PPE domain-containing protein n=1 Tax=Gordonia sp. CPCC 205515 TaxID=3140791 RepID=UPI003AF34D02
MIVGFTGVIWEARPADRLAHDLHDGLGPVHLAESGAAWAKLGAELVDIGVEYGKILADLGLHWESSSYNHAFTKLTQMVPWFADAASHAAFTAGKAEEQAVATTVALTAMPNPVEIAATEAIQDALSHVHMAAGSPLHAVAADTERAHQDQKQRASRVMESYERATTQVSAPWQQPNPPKIVAADALNAEVAAAREAAENAKAAVPSGIHAGLAAAPAIGGIRGGVAAGSYQREKTKYTAVDLAAEVSPAPAAAQSGTGMSAEPTRSAMPMAPMSAAAAQGNRDEDVHHAESYGVTAAATGATASEVNLPAGWVQADQHDSAVTWSDIANRYETPKPTLPEGVLNLGNTVAPAVLGAPDGGGP